MNSRERVNTTLNHKEPDKVPIDLGGNQSSIHMKAYKRLLNYVEIEDKDIKFADFLQQIAAPCEELLEKFEVDVRYIRPLGGMVKPDFEPQYEGKYVKVISQGTIGVVGYFKQIILIPQNKYCFGLEIHTKNSTYIYISYDVMYLMLISDLEVEDFKEIYE